MDEHIATFATASQTGIAKSATATQRGDQHDRGVDKEWFQTRLAAVGRSQADLARALGVDASAISRLMKGERQVKAPELPIIARMLEVDISFLMTKLQVPGRMRKLVEDLEQDLAERGDRLRHSLASQKAPPLSKVGESREYGRPVGVQPFIPGPATAESSLPVYGTAVGGDDGWFELNGQVVDRIARPPVLQNVPTAYAIFMTGTSMEPRYLEGETIYVHPGKPVTPGSFVVVQLVPEEPGQAPKAMVKQFLRRTPTKVVLHQYNPPKDIEIPQDQILSMHRIVLGGE